MPLDLTINHPSLSLQFCTTDLSLHVNCQNKIWHSLPGFQPYIEYLPTAERHPSNSRSMSYETSLYFEGMKIPFVSAGEIHHRSFTSGVGEGVVSTFKGFKVAQTPIPLELETRLWIESATGVLHLELIPLVDDPGVLRVIFPAPFALSQLHPSCYTVIPMMQGSLIPNDWPQELHTHSIGMLLSRAGYMPWWGQVDGRAAAISIVETPWDAGYKLEHPSGGPTQLTPIWHASLGMLRYRRKIQMHFVADGDYNHLAKIYRSFARAHGPWRTLVEKAAAKPALERLMGTPVIHTGIAVHVQPDSSYYNHQDLEANDSITAFSERSRQLVALKAKGVEQAYVHLDGWGRRGYDNLHPDILPPCERAGGWEGMRELVNVCHELGYQIIVHDQYRDYYKDADSYDPEQAVHTECGTIPEVAFWYGGAQAFLCATFAPDTVRRNHMALEQAGVHLDGAYLDVFAVVELDECFHPEHRISRRECMELRCQSFNVLGSQGKIVSSEEPVEFAVPYVDLVHHGPYALTPDYENCPARGIPVPLFNLVFHDCLILPWALTCGGWGIPQGESGLLHAYLNGGTGYLSIDADEAEIQRVQQLCAFQARVAKEEMVRHEFIEGNYNRQRSIFANGTCVEVDFETGDFKLIE